jgi:hypothetical protein
MSAPSFAAGPDPLHDLRELSRQVQDLQRRVLALEDVSGIAPPIPPLPTPRLLHRFPCPGLPLDST